MLVLQLCARAKIQYKIVDYDEIFGAKFCHGRRKVGRGKLSQVLLQFWFISIKSVFFYKLALKENDNILSLDLIFFIKQKLVRLFFAIKPTSYDLQNPNR